MCNYLFLEQKFLPCVGLWLFYKKKKSHFILPWPSQSSPTIVVKKMLSTYPVWVKSCVTLKGWSKRPIQASVLLWPLISLEVEYLTGLMEDVVTWAKVLCFYITWHTHPYGHSGPGKACGCLGTAWKLPGKGWTEKCCAWAPQRCKMSMAISGPGMFWVRESAWM